MPNGVDCARFAPGRRGALPPTATVAYPGAQVVMQQSCGFVASHRGAGLPPSHKAAATPSPCLLVRFRTLLRTCCLLRYM